MVVELTYKNGRSELLVVDYIKDKVIDENSLLVLEDPKPKKLVKYLEYQVSEDLTVSKIWYVKDLSFKNYEENETMVITSEKDVRPYMDNPDYSVVESYKIKNIPKGGLQPCMSPISSIPVSSVRTLRVLSL